jgi:hypothetical protein
VGVVAAASGLLTVSVDGLAAVADVAASAAAGLAVAAGAAAAAVAAACFAESLRGWADGRVG